MSSRRRYKQRKQAEVEASKKRHPSGSTSRKSPTNPNFSVGNPIYPDASDGLYVYGQHVTKVRSERGKPIGPYTYIRITQDCVFGDDKLIAEFLSDRWWMDENEKGYYEIVVSDAAGLQEEPKLG